MKTPTYKRWKDMGAFELAFAKNVIKYASRANVALYRASKGRIGGRFIGGEPVLLLTTLGRKSAQPRTMPVLYLADGDRYVVVASKGGYDKHPDWYLNLLATPKVTVEVGAEKRTMLARTANEEERAALWPRLVAMYAGYEEYQQKTDRKIPVVILSPL